MAWLPESLGLMDLHFGGNVAESVLEAIRHGNWDFEPSRIANDGFASTEALPGSGEKLKILADRVNGGLPLWHPSDRLSFNDLDDF